MLVALAGRARAGKDTTAALLGKELGFKRLAFADKLKELTAAFLRLSPEFVKTDAFKVASVAVRLDAVSYRKSAGNVGKADLDCGDVLAGRDVLQRLGVAAREVFGENFWVDQALSPLIPLGAGVEYGHAWLGGSVDIPEACVLCQKTAVTHAHAAITDVRFWNELEAVKAAGGLIVRVNRADAADARHDFEAERVLSPTHTQRLSEAGNPVCFKCYLPERSHPSHFSGDTHESETTLPDSGDCYDLVVESDSAEETAAQVLAWVKAKTGTTGL